MKNLYFKEWFNTKNRLKQKQYTKQLDTPGHIPPNNSRTSRIYENYNSEEGFALFSHAFQNLEDPASFLALSDFLQDHGFPNLSHYINAKLNNQSTENFYKKTIQELSENGMNINYNILSFKNCMLTINHSTIEIADQNGIFQPLTNENISEAYPGLSFLLIDKYKTNPYQKNLSYSDKMLNSFLSDYYDIINNTSKWIYYSPPEEREESYEVIVKTLKKINNLLLKMNKGKIQILPGLKNMLLTRLNDYMMNNYSQEIKTLASLTLRTIEHMDS